MKNSLTISSWWSLVLLCFCGLQSALAMPDSVEVVAGANQFELDPEQIYADANTAYEAGNYVEAIQGYESLLGAGFFSFEVHYNLGNTYYKSGELARAILNFERAAKINPRDKDLKHNLEVAYLKQQDKELDSIPLNIFASSWRAVIKICSARSWARWAIIFAWICVIGFGLYWFANTLSLRRIGFFSFLIGLLLALSSWGLGASRKAFDGKQRFVIIMAPSSIIKSAPAESSTNLYILREGFKLRITDQAGDWMEVTLADGNVGWVRASEVEEI
jgi:tetratricopeptide (TPR) repeat protein